MTYLVGVCGLLDTSGVQSLDVEKRNYTWSWIDKELRIRHMFYDRVAIEAMGRFYIAYVHPLFMCWNSIAEVTWLANATPVDRAVIDRLGMRPRIFEGSRDPIWS